MWNRQFTGRSGLDILLSLAKSKRDPPNLSTMVHIRPTVAILLLLSVHGFAPPSHHQCLRKYSTCPFVVHSLSTSHLRDSRDGEDNADMDQSRLRRAYSTVKKSAKSLALGVSVVTMAARPTFAAPEAVISPPSEVLEGVQGQEIMDEEDNVPVYDSENNVDGNMDVNDDGNDEDDYIPPSLALSSPTTSVLEGYKVPILSVSTVAAAGIGLKGYKYYKTKKAKDEEERLEQFRRIMGPPEGSAKTSQSDPFASESSNPDLPVIDANTASEEEDLFGSGDVVDPTSRKSQTSKKATSEKSDSPPLSSPPPAPSKKKKSKLSSMFAKPKKNAREVDLQCLIQPSAMGHKFALLLSQYLTYGAPQRFPEIEATPDFPFPFDVDKAREVLIEKRNEGGLTSALAAESFANVVNCMIISLVDAASSTLPMNEPKQTAKALNVVLDFMEHAGSLYEAVAEGIEISPVIYGGDLGSKKLEKMYKLFVKQNMAGMGDLLGGEGGGDRSDQLRAVFDISEKKAEKISSKVMMSSMMDMLRGKGDGGGLEDMMKNMEEMMGGEEGMKEMMESMGGEAGMEDMAKSMGLDMDALSGGIPNMEDINPEELKQSVKMMKELVASGQIGDEQIASIKEEFKKQFGEDIDAVYAKAEQDKDGIRDELGEDGAELLELFKNVLNK